MVSPLEMTVRVKGTAICKRLDVKKGESARTGKKYEMHAVELHYMGGAMELVIEPEVYNTLEEGRTYEFEGDIRQDGYNLRVSSVEFIEIE